MSETRANDGSDLIVDFGDRRRLSETDGEVPATTRQVSFIKDVVVHYFQYPSTDEVTKRWNSKKDKHTFQQQLIHDVQSIRLLLSTTPMDALEKEVLYECVGLEALISIQVMRFVKEKRRRHTRSIVEMQDCLSEDHLSAYAESQSSESRERAQKIAAGNLKILS